MKKLKIGLALGLLLSALSARGEQIIMCNNATTAGPCVNQPANLPGTDAQGWVTTAPFNSIILSIKASSATASTAVIEFLPCNDCDPVRFPRSGDQPITNIGSDPNALTRSFKLPAHIPRVRWNLLTNAGSPPINAYLTYEY